VWRRSPIWTALAGALLFAVIAGLGGSSARSASCTNVSTPNGLVVAVTGASANGCIQLAPGNYAISTSLDVTVNNLTVEGPATAPGATISGGVMTNPSTTDPGGQLDIFAVASGASLNIHDVVLTQAIQPGNGAVVVESGGAATVSYALLSGNTGNGVFVKAGGQATVTNTTINNSINGFDGILLGGTATLNEDTIANNAGNGIDKTPAATASVTNTILSNNALGNCSSSAGLTGSHDGDSGTTCGATITTGGFSNVSAGLSPLANNGGPSGTLALMAASPAIDHGTGAGAAADDQRHFTRDGSPDIGAYEFGAHPVGATLTVKKIVVGGTAQSSDFTLTVKDTTTNTTLDSSPGSPTGKQVSVPAGDTYTVTESGGPAGYTESDSPGCAGTAVANGTPTCTITNSDLAPLTVKKVVVGPGKPSDFTLTVTDTSANNAVLDSSPGSSTGHVVSVPVGDNYTVTESGATQANYTPASSADCSGTATQGGTPTCTITNTAKPTTLTVKKFVVGGTAQPSDFMMTVTDTTTNTALAPSPFAGSNLGTPVSVPAGDNYTVTESGAQTANYVASKSAGCSGTAAANGTPTCTITNSDVAALTVKKLVVGPGKPSDFTLKVTDTTASNTVLDSSPGSSTGHVVSVPVGDNYTVTESGATAANYTPASSADCSGTATQGGTPSCTITNTAKPTKLTVKKVVVGGTAAPGDFTLTVKDTTTNTTLDSSPGSSSGKQVSVPAGDTYAVTESGAQTADYNESDSAGCTGTATANGVFSCTITNTANPAGGGGGGGGGGGKPKRSHLKVILRVSGGAAVPSAFKVHVRGGSVKPHATFPGSKQGTKVSLNHGSYSVSAKGPKGYKEKASGGCSGTLGAGKSKTCTITETHH
jgi:hypothetical protein